MYTVLLSLVWIALKLIIVLIAVIIFKEISSELKKPTTNLPQRVFILKYVRIVAVVFVVIMIAYISSDIKAIMRALLK